MSSRAANSSTVATAMRMSRLFVSARSTRSFRTGSPNCFHQSVLTTSFASSRENRHSAGTSGHGLTYGGPT